MLAGARTELSSRYCEIPQYANPSRLFSALNIDGSFLSSAEAFSNAHAMRFTRQANELTCCRINCIFVSTSVLRPAGHGERLMRRRDSYPVLICLILVSAAMIFGGIVRGRTIVELAGRVTDPVGNPIMGASVVLLSEGRTVSGTATDFKGAWQLSIPPDLRQPVTLRVTSVGFKEQKKILTLSPTRLARLDIVCEPTPIEVAGIKVTSPQSPKTSELSVPSAEVEIAASRSLVPSNPIAALRLPQMARIGSNHSSQLRIDGTNPRYCLNGIPIGADPEHYGMLAILPASVVSEIRFYPQGANASYALPSTVDLITPADFEKHSQGRINISTIDATGSYAVGNKRFFALGAIRQSILNNVLDVTGMNRDRKSVPPIDYRDLFFSTGLQLSRRWRIILDQYYVRDRMSFDTLSAIGVKMAMGMAEKTKEDFLGLRLSALYDHLFITASAATRGGYKEYVAYPNSDPYMYDINVRLSENYRNNLAGLDASFTFGNLQLKAGHQVDWAVRRSVDLNQFNWSFQPPFANTGNPYIYQDELNYAYDIYNGNSKGSTSVTYLSESNRIGRFALENGVRYEHFSELRQSNALLSRHTVKVSITEHSSFELFLGTFAETPVSNILDPYQTLIRANLSELTWSRTWLLAATAIYGPLRVSAFVKRMSDLPYLTPDCGNIWIPYYEGGILRGRKHNTRFLTMQSYGSARFSGISFAYDTDHLLTSRVKCYLSYAYSRANVEFFGVAIPYDLWAPHRLTSQIGYRITQRLSAGTELQVHTGYPHSPNRFDSSYDPVSYDSLYFATQLAKENTLRFTTNFTLNVYASWQVGSVELFMTVANVTNRTNAIVYTGREYVTDPGILPSIGFRWSF
jgi:hypothetical protein